jgi:hypothetical protein
MIVFELTMPHKGSWNGKWSEEGTCFARTRSERIVPKEYWNENFYYRWDDGWSACVSVEKVDCKEGNELRKKSKGFCGYNWMVDSIIKKGVIEYVAESEG